MTKNADLTAQIHALLPEVGFQRPPQAMRLLSVSKTTLYRLVQDGRLAPPVKLGLRASAWRNSDINAFLRSL